MCDYTRLCHDYAYYSYYSDDFIFSTTPRALHGDEEAAIEKAVTASVEWNMVRMDLLAHYKLKHC